MSFTKIDHYEKEYVDHHHDSALSVTEGVADQPIVNPYFVRKKKHRLSTEEYVKGILEGNITTLSQAITLIESSNPDHYAQAQEIIERCLPMPAGRCASASPACRARVSRPSSRRSATWSPRCATSCRAGYRSQFGT